MSFRECIVNGVEEGAIKQGQAKVAQDLFLDELDATAGNEIEAARNTFAQLKRDAARKKHLTIKRVQRFAALSNEMKEYIPAFQKKFVLDNGKVTYQNLPRPGKYLQSLVDFEEGTPRFTTNLVGTYKAVRGNAFAMFDQGLMKNRQALTGRKGKAENHDLLLEVFGNDTGNEAAKIVAKQWLETAEMLRLRANAAGMAIPKRLDYGLPQKHEQVAVATADKNDWIKFVRGDDNNESLLDVSKMIDEKTGKPFTPASLEIALNEVYETIQSGGLNKIKAGVVGQGKALANRRQDHRFLVFKDAKSWLKYQDRFGDPDVFGTMMSHIESMSRDIAMLEVLGPNPATTIAALKIQGQKIANNFDKGKGNQRATNQFNADFAKFEAMNDRFTGEANIPANVFGADIVAGLRNFTTASLLGSVTPLAVPGDMNTARITAAMAGIPVSKMMTRMLKQISPLSAAERARFGTRLGIAAENWMANSHAQARYFGEVVGPNFSVVVSDTILRATGLNAWTQGARQAFGIEMLGHLADLKNKKYAQLPKATARTLANYGINESRWDIIRKTKPEVYKGSEFVRPLNIENRTDLAPNIGREISTQLQSLIHNESNKAVPQATIRGSATVMGRVQRGTIPGEIVTSAFQFKSFPVSIMQGNMLRYLKHDLQNKTAFSVDFFITMAIAGALGMQARFIAAGQDPMDMTDERFWGQALLTGGGLGIIGDFLFADRNRFGGSFSQTLAGPLPSTVGKFLDLTAGNAMQLAMGEETKFGSELVNFLSDTFPGQNIWYIRAALERGIIDRARQWADDEAEIKFYRKEMKRMKERGQRSFWEFGDLLPSRAPDFSAALGN